MPTIVYQVNKKTGVKYAYESISYWDKDKQAPRSKRRYLGRVDQETGEIIKKKEKNTSAEESSDLAQLRAELEEKDALIASLQEKLQVLTERLAKIHALSSSGE